MKNKFYMLAAITIAFFGNMNAQVVPVTGDAVAKPTTVCPSPGGTNFAATVTYTPSIAVHLDVNNTGTDNCQEINSGRTIQVMAWDYVSVISPLTSKVYVSWNFNDVQKGSLVFDDGFDPDVAVWSDSMGTFMEIVFENNLTGRIDGYTYIWNTTTQTFNTYSSLPNKCTLTNDPTMKCKNPNLAATKDRGRFAVVWHEEGLVNPPAQLVITYNTSPQVTYTNTVSIMQSRVYVYASDRSNYLPDLLGSPTSTIVNIKGEEVIRTTPVGTNNLFDRNYNPDVSFSEEAIGTGMWPTERVVSVAFLTAYFNPATFSIVSDGLSVVQGGKTDFRPTLNPTTTTTKNFTRSYEGKPRIAARFTLNGTYVAKDFSVVMGNASATGGCTPGPIMSKLHFWWNETGTGSIVCPTGGTNIIASTSYANSGITTTNPVISCVNAKGHYAVAFETNLNSTYDIVANTYRQGSLVTAGNFSYVNYGTCVASQNGNQVIPSITSFRKPGANQVDNAYSNYLFWDHVTKTLDYKKVTTQNVPGGGVQLRQMEDQTDVDKNQVKFTAYPNPTDSEISFDFKLDANEIASEIEIFNLSGQSVDKFAVTETATQKRAIDKMPSGVYIAILKTNLQNHRLQFIRK